MKPTDTEVARLTIAASEVRKRCGCVAGKAGDDS